MQVQVRKVTEEDLESLVNVGRSIGKGSRCGVVGETAPDIATIEGAMVMDLALMAEAGNAPKGLVLYRKDGTIKWLVIPNNAAFADVARALMGAVLTECGVCRGAVANPTVRDKLIAAGCVQEDQSEWIHYDG